MVRTLENGVRQLNLDLIVGHLMMWPNMQATLTSTTTTTTTTTTITTTKNNNDNNKSNNNRKPAVIVSVFDSSV